MRSLAVNVVVAANLFAAPVVAAGCDGILSLTRDISVDQRSAVIASQLHDRYCEGSALIKGKTFDLGIDSTIKQIPLKLQLGSGSTEEQMSHMCSSYDSWYNENQQTLSVAIKTGDRAIVAWERCKELEDQDVFFSVDPRVELLALGVRRGKDVIQFLGMDYLPKEMVCTGPFGEEGKEVVIDKDTRFTLSSSKEQPITCRRKYATMKDAAGNEVQYLPATEITLEAEGAPALPISLPREEKYEPAYSSAVAARIDSIKAEIAADIEALRSKAAADDAVVSQQVADAVNRSANFAQNLSVEVYDIGHGQNNLWPGQVTHYIGCEAMGPYAEGLCSGGTLVYNVTLYDTAGGCGNLRKLYVCVKKPF